MVFTKSNQVIRDKSTIIIRGDGPANRHPSELVHPVQHGTADLAPDVVEVTVDFIGGGFGQFVVEIRRFVIDVGVEIEFADESPPLDVRPRDSHHFTLHNFGDLADRAPHTARRTRHHHRVALHGFADSQETEVGRVAGHPQNPQGQRLG